MYITVDVQDIIGTLDIAQATWDEGLQRLTLSTSDWANLVPATDKPEAESSSERERDSDQETASEVGDCEEQKHDARRPKRKLVPPTLVSRTRAYRQREIKT